MVGILCGFTSLLDNVWIFSKKNTNRKYLQIMGRAIVLRFVNIQRGVGKDKKLEENNRSLWCVLS